MFIFLVVVDRYLDFYIILLSYRSIAQKYQNCCKNIVQIFKYSVSKDLMLPTYPALYSIPRYIFISLIKEVILVFLENEHRLPKSTIFT